MPLRRELRLALIPLFVLFVTFAVYWREFLTRSSYGYSSEVNVPEPPVNPTKPPQQTNEEYGDKEDPRVCVPSPSTTVKEQKPLQPHVWRDDGLLEVNPDGAHPILQLIDKAQKKWEDKKARASTTLRQAVKEYERRYNRKPPAGFDKWWDYVEKHSVQLPDEYDQIWRDIEPFWGYSPPDLQRIQSERETHQESFTLGKNETNGPIHVLRVAFPEHMQWEPEALLGGARSIQEVLKDVQTDLPLFRAVISPHDSPTLFTDFDVKKAALFAAARGEHLDVNNLPAAPRLGWLSGCGPKSPARDHSALQTGRKTFIHDHLKVMDPCVHPEVFQLQGEFLVHPDPVPEKLLIPQFAFCSTKMHHDIQIPTLSGWIDDINPREDDPDWDDKADERMNWRGSNTGMWHAPYTRWRESQRARLVDFAAGLNGTVKVIIPPKSDKEPVGEGKELQRAAINPAIFDIAFSGEPVGCHEDTCPELLKIYEWRKKHGQKDSGRFKYIVDVDGNAWSSRFKRLITTNSLIFKATVYPEWFYDRIEPWVHYVPIQVDYSDVHDALIFFRGGMYGEGAHHDLAKKIAVEGRNWSRTLWRKEDVTAYTYRLILEYARVMSSDREAMSYHG